MSSKSTLATFVALIAIVVAISACGSSNNMGGTSPVAPPMTGTGLGPTTGVGTPTTPGAAPSTSGLPSNMLGTGGATALPTPGAGGTLAPGGTGGAGMMMMAPSNAMGMAGAASPGGVAWTPGGRLDASGVLIAPAANEGFQIKTSVFTLNPGDEVYNCFHAAVPSNAVFPVGEWDAQMSPGSHHFILYRAGGDSTPDRTLTNPGCTSGFGGNTWLYTQGSPRGHLPFPDGVAMELAAGERIIFDMHYINTTNAPIQASVVLNVYKVRTPTYMKADSQVSFNVNIAIPPNGMQTVGGDCTPPPGASFFVMATHTHKRAILAQINRKLADGTLGEAIVTTTNWDNPTPSVWQQAPFLTFKPGEMFHYKCTYMNDRASLVTVGTSAESNEMCMAEGYFFPASATTPSCTSDAE
jgi:Copper type II ascorbate-dependent monooxygenase, C-terminal domain